MDHASNEPATEPVAQPGQMRGMAWPGGGGGLHLDADHSTVGRFADQIDLVPVAVPVLERLAFRST